MRFIFFVNYAKILCQHHYVNRVYQGFSDSPQADRMGKMWCATRQKRTISAGHRTPFLPCCALPSPAAKFRQESDKFVNFANCLFSLPRLTLSF